EGYMKANKPWTTRTGMAVAGLHSRVEGRGSMIKLVLGHGVSYGVYLELGHKVKSKKGKVREVKPYAILKPTMEKYYPEISKNVQRIWQS
ncbi:MAG TPA: hypothetical protein PKV93_13535, partial [Fervidobacterium sp.]|nr:hypothetical protein [Fervidobacterium sp.]